MASLYIHIPFCKKKCLYCNFVSYAGREDLIDEYVGAIVKEIQFYQERRGWALLHSSSFVLRTPADKSSFGGQGSSPTTIYFGGGTPSLLEPQHFEALLSSLVPLPSSLEITMEANPGTVTLKKLKAYRDLGINRLSLGAQSFNDKHLKILGRIHQSEDIYRAMEEAKEAGFKNINLDLIFALPNQTLEDWKADLQKAVSLNPQHLSTYNLQIEEETGFFEVISNNQIPCLPAGTANPPPAPRLRRAGKQIPITKLKIPNEDEELAMYEYAIEFLKDNGYEHYEISAFAKPGRRCRHNLAYWKNENYIGVGAGAHSHVDGKRWANSEDIEDYIVSGDPVGTQNFVSPHMATSNKKPKPEETIFMGLRLLDGISVENFLGFEKEVEELISDGLLCRENGNYKLTRQGLYLANLVFIKFV